MKMYSIKDGKLVCEEVKDGIVPVAYDEEVVSDGKVAFKVVGRGSGKILQWLNGLCDLASGADFDSDFASLYPKQLTLGGLLTPKEVELDRDNKIVPDVAMVEKAKKIREALEKETKSSSGWELGMKKLGEAIPSPSYEPPVSIVADQFEYSHEPLDIASMYPGDTISEKATTLGGLLAPNEVDMASCGDLTAEPLIRFPYLTFNMMATDTKDYDETDWYKSDNVQIHEKICQELNKTYEKKNADYGNSFENSLDKHGLIAGIIRMDDKMSRLISLNSKKEQQVLDESLRDTLMDLANYAIMSVMWLDEQ